MKHLQTSYACDACNACNACDVVLNGAQGSMLHMVRRFNSFRSVLFFARCIFFSLRAADASVATTTILRSFPQGIPQLTCRHSCRRRCGHRCSLYAVPAHFIVPSLLKLKGLEGSRIFYCGLHRLAAICPNRKNGSGYWN